ncbi:MAG TPA: hypothetical protein VG347_01855, partial [Verrucomicrobiae bacterium]|nr:hypothetical protein [Verrucomicrobiae bacterium]
MTTKLNQSIFRKKRSVSAGFAMGLSSSVIRRLEHFQKSYSRSVMAGVVAVFLGFGFVSAQSQGCSSLLLR